MDNVAKKYYARRLQKPHGVSCWTLLSTAPMSIAISGFAARSWKKVWVLCFNRWIDT